jgi:rhamnosyltransferase
VEASIIIRTKNEATHLRETLTAVFAQEVSSFEVIVVDSGSTDRTLEIASSFPIRILTIKPKDFTYGYALNLGARAARGRYLVALSGHATPMDGQWLGNMLAGFTGSEVAGVYSRLFSRPNAYLHQRIVTGFFYGPEARTFTTYCSYHNTSSAVRRELWQVHPFQEDMPGGEDQAWARKSKAMGYRIVYAPSSRVWHSHDDETPFLFARRFWTVGLPGLGMIALDYLKDRGLDLREQREKLKVANWQDARNQLK